MSQRRVKQIRRQVRKTERHLIDRYVDALMALSFKERIEAAWLIARGKR